ncbi:Putative enzyme related to lactoylglutathione lyase OS=Streptomyces violarus OX=67380 GN=FHS41_005012 PE=4 SV=1 [Streptomyces violarus]
MYREFGTGPERGTVYFLGGGFLEVSGRSDPAGAGRAAVAPGRRRGGGAGRAAGEGRGDRPAAGEGALGLVEMWIADPDGTPIVPVEVPADHPMRYRPGI